MEGIGVLQSKEHHKQPFGEQGQDTLPTGAHQAVHQSLEQGWQLLHVLVLHFSMTDYREAETWHL